MFTFGREQSKEKARHYLKSQQESWRIDAVIDAIHDLAEGCGDVDAVKAAFVECFVNGGSGAWEQAGSWLTKIARDFPVLAELWRDVCQHKSATVRFRAAAFLDQMPSAEFSFCFPVLLSDVSVKVRSKTASDRFDTDDSTVRAALAKRLEVESNSKVKQAIEFALTYKQCIQDDETIHNGGDEEQK